MIMFFCRVVLKRAVIGQAWKRNLELIHLTLYVCLILQMNAHSRSRKIGIYENCNSRKAVCCA